jgi:hypothetical protein
MATTEPEKTITLIKEAADTLESKAVVDRQFPDLYKTFTRKKIWYYLTQRLLNYH